MQFRELFFGKWILLAGIFFLLTSVTSNYSVEVTRYSVETGKKAEEGLVIAQLSDVHLIRTEYQKRKILEKVEEEKPDLIVFTGDLVDYFHFDETVYLDRTLEFCQEICTLAPVYYVYGNHEIELLTKENGPDYARRLQEAGVRILNQGYESFEKNGRVFDLIGIEDPLIQENDPDCGYDHWHSAELLAELTANLEEGNPRILFAHRPELLDCYADGFGIDVVLTGHAHGGQIRLPYFNLGLYAPAQGFFPKYTSGIYRKNSTRMVVSRGLGSSRFPIRIFNTPEIVMIEVR